MYRYIRHNPEEVGQTPGSNTSATPPKAVPEIWGLKRIQDEEVGKLIPDEKYFTEMERATTSTIKTLPYINEIINRVADEMEALGFEDTKNFSKNSIPTVDNALRTKKEQKKLFDAKVAEIKADNPKLTDRQAKAKADDAVANPTGPRAPTPHMTGRAVDFNLLIPGTTEMDTDFDNCMKMWNSYKWKVFNHLLQNRYRVMNLSNEPWHYEFGMLADENITHIKALEKDGKIMVDPKIPEYLKDKTKINIELARKSNAVLAKKFPYATDFDIGTADFAFYIGYLQKRLKKKVTGIFDARTAESLKKFLLKKEPILEVKYNQPKSFPLPLLKSNVDSWLDEFDLSSFFVKTAVVSLALGSAYYLFKNKRRS